MLTKAVSVADAVRMTLEALGLRSRSYYLVFRSPSGAEVLRDLSQFCRADGRRLPWGATSTDIAREVGRQEVWNRIMQHLKLTPEELYDLYGGKYPITTPEENDE